MAPIVNAGPNASVSVFGAASLVGTVTDDGKPGPTVTTTWSKASGPGTVTFASPGALATTATFSQAGTYTLRLTANDGALSGFDDVVITVLTTPTVNAGPNRTVTMPAAANLDGTVNGGGGPAQTTWSMVDGPGTVTFTNASAVDTTARFSQPGSYTLRLTANNGVLSAFDDMVVTVRQLPSVSAGPDLTITLGSSASLDGTLLNPGSPGPVTYRWTRVGGPGGNNAVIFTSPTSVDTSVRFTRTGTFTLRLTATNGAGSASDDVVVTVQR